MSEEITLRYDLERASLVAGMVQGGKTMLKAYRDWPYTIASLVLYSFAIMGGVGLGLAVWTLALDRSGPVAPLIFAGVIAGIIVFFGFFRRVAQAQATFALGSRYGRLEQTMILNTKGVAVMNAHSNWQSDWSVVEGVAQTKAGLAIIVSGCVFTVPNNAFSAEHPKDAVHRKVSEWIAQAQA